MVDAVYIEVKIGEGISKEKNKAIHAVIDIYTRSYMRFLILIQSHTCCF